jgi:hypothetical protein
MLTPYLVERVSEQTCAGDDPAAKRAPPWRRILNDGMKISFPLLSYG